MISFAPGSIMKYTSINKSSILLEKFVLAQVGIVPPKKERKQKILVDDPLKYARVGVKIEKNVVKMYEQQTGIQVHPGKTINIICGDKFQIKGRCDGQAIINGIQYIIEVKTRSTNNFGMTKQERIQCMCYCQGTESPGLIFVEYGKDDELIIGKYDNFLEDTRFAWDMMLLDLDIVCNFIDNVKNDPGKYIEDNKLKPYETFSMVPWF